MADIVSLDLETTGLDPVGDAITEIGAVRFNGNRVEGEYHTLVNPRKKIPREIVQLTGITDAMVRHAPLFQEVQQDLAAFCDGAIILGHNVAFDLGFLQARGLLEYADRIDTYSLASVLLPKAGRYNLAALGQFFNIPLPATHRALDDARVTHALFIQLREMVGALPLDLLAEIVRLGETADWGGEWVFREALQSRARESLAAKKTTGRAADPGPIFNIGWEMDPREKIVPLIPDPEPAIPLDLDEVAAILEYGGEFSRHFPQYEQRAEQIEMLRQVGWALSGQQHLMVEAGTGTGKSVAYMIPAGLFALQNNTRVVISTNTINLQDQLINKDIPSIIEALDVPLRATVLKGRSNYLCPRRLNVMRQRGVENADELRVLAKVLMWMEQNATGDRQEINLNTPGERMVWERISAADDNCTTDTCSGRMGGICPFHKVKQAAQTAHIIIVNHALLLADVATGNRVLPEYQYLIMDEAHHMESAVTGALSFNVTRSNLERVIRELGGPNAGAFGRLLSALQDTIEPGHFAAINQLVEQATSYAFHFQNSSGNFFVTIDNFLLDMREGKDLGSYSQQVRILPATRTQPAWMDVETSWDESQKSLGHLLANIEQIGQALGDLLDSGFDDVVDEYGNLGNVYRRLSEMNEQINGLVFEPAEDAVYWAEIQPRGRRLSLQAAPLHIGPLMRKHIWHEKKSAILTSATLTTNGSFEYLSSRLFGEDADTIQLGSPYDYESQAMLYVINDIPEPSDRYGHQRAVNEGLIAMCKATGGRTLVLFTSYAQLKTTAQAISGALGEQGIIVYEQGGGASPHTLVESFKSADQAVLLGTRSFWEGVDIPGEALSALAIIKLPFDVPSDPIIAARSETFEAPFYEYTIPEAILKFRQGFGRLIRTKYDRGIVAIFDRRVLTKQYGRAFIESLPPCTVEAGPLHGLASAAEQWLNL